ncbi:hypothetical protein MMC25_006752, partial [Agyrium rufum]|nr:hypothetical protein [Agyrium rufum]
MYGVQSSRLWNPLIKELLKSYEEMDADMTHALLKHRGWLSQVNADNSMGSAKELEPPSQPTAADIQTEIDSRWILNRSMRFCDRLDREKFFMTYMETPTQWRRVTVTCDYRDAPPDSPESDLKKIQYQRHRSNRIYAEICDSLPEIQFYDTLTNLRLEMIDDRLHIHVSEDIGEAIDYPEINDFAHLDVPCFPESVVEFVSHVARSEYKVRIGDRFCFKRDIPDSDYVASFLDEVNALSSGSTECQEMRLYDDLVEDSISVVPSEDMETDYQKPYEPNASPSRTGQTENTGYWSQSNSIEDTDPFDDREFLFQTADGKVKMPGLVNLDTGLKVPGGMIMGLRYAKELGREHEIDRAFSDPCLRSISGHLTPITGILRDVVFRLKGSSKTFRRDFYICDAIDDMVDIMFGASFIKEQFKMLFENVKSLCSTFATWSPWKTKESAVERIDRQSLQREQKMKANELEIKRLQKEQGQFQARQQLSQQ